jgi:N-acetylmuramoyl-L-alanine amidase
MVFHTVVSGDTLSGLSYRFDISQNDLVQMNNLQGEALRVGQRLRVVRPKTAPLRHQVEEMDSLESIAYLYNKEAEDLRSLNGLSDNDIQPGQSLLITPHAMASARIPNTNRTNERTSDNISPSSDQPEQNPEEIQENNEADAQGVEISYRVKAGDTLYGLSRRFGVKAEEVKAWNNLGGSLIRVGQELILYSSNSETAVTNAENSPTAEATTNIDTPQQDPEDRVTSQDSPFIHSQNQENETALDLSDPTLLSWDSYVILDREVPLYEWNNDFYYWSHPGLVSQPNRGYYEDEEMTPKLAYERGRILFERFAQQVSKKPKVSNILEGITIVLDPGHGGLDPGAIVKSSDGTGDTLYVTEDEYVYDIALRMYILLKSHGANVELTILSPNHLIRDTTPATQTLIHEKNEVFNKKSLSNGTTNDLWPIGGRRGLSNRVSVARDLFALYPGTETVFVSLHADNSPFSPEGTGALYYEDDDTSDSEGKEFAQAMLPYMGSKAYVRGQELGVLRNNPADHKLLIEVRNVAFKDQAWALRFANTRQMDAMKIVNGILQYFK